MKQSQFQPRRKAGKPAALRAAVSLTLSALAAWSYTPAQAQTSGNAAVNGTLAPVVVSASRFPNDPAFPPVAATVITAEQIREAGIDNANEAIRKLGGVYGRQSLAGPNDFPLDLRGFGTNGDQNMVVLVDGVRISENELTTPLLSSIPIETVERIEIVRGGSSVLYGSGATGGTIQIITKRPQANAGYGSIVGEVGTDGQRAGRAFVSRGWENMSIDASYAKARSDGWRDNTRSNQENFSTTVQWFASDWRFGLRANIAQADYGLAGALSLAQFNANPRQTKTPFDYGSYDNNSITAFLERRFGAFDVAAELSHREKVARANFVSSTFQSNTNVRNTQFSPRIRHVLESGGVQMVGSGLAWGLAGAPQPGIPLCAHGCRAPQTWHRAAGNGLWHGTGRAAGEGGSEGCGATLGGSRMP
ncbi:TonB-dependent receptor plug domain-containing protein, partial [Herbaspirillum sp.]|uniref:TonB-dependent receptor n=1 Tax=Herbaspirillum sp. TaxID=1890675 RepID=UPI0031D295B2